MSASESVEDHPVKLIAILRKTSPPSVSDSPVQESEPARIPLFPIDIRKDSIPSPSNGSGATFGSSTYPTQYRRLQFQIATANNDRRRELRQRFTVHLNVEATLANGTKCNVCETSTAPITVRGRRPRNFQARTEIPLLGDSSSSGEGPKPNALELPRFSFTFDAPNFPATPALAQEEW